MAVRTMQTVYFFYFFFNDPTTTEIYTLSLHDALPIWKFGMTDFIDGRGKDRQAVIDEVVALTDGGADYTFDATGNTEDRKSTRLNSSHSQISYAVFCSKKKKKNKVI